MSRGESKGHQGPAEGADARHMKDLQSMMEDLMKSADPGEPCWKRLEVILQCLGVGRGEEDKYVNCDDWLLDKHLQVILAEWVEVKTLNSYPVAFTCDADGFAFDMFDALSDVWVSICVYFYLCVLNLNMYILHNILQVSKRVGLA